MHHGKFIFAQIVEFVSQYEFDKCVNRYDGNSRVRSLSCRDQFLALVFGQLANLRSLRGIVLCLNAHAKLLYHLGFKTANFALATLSRANEKRNWQIYRDLAQVLIERARKLYAGDHDFQIELEGAVYALDSTIVELCLTVFKWAFFKQEKSAVKIHTQLDLRGNIPSFFLVTEAKTHDVNFLDALEFETGAFYVMDRGYLDFKRLWKIKQAGSYFVIRSKKNMAYERMYSAAVDRAAGLRCDQTIKLTGFYARRHYPEKLRRVKYFDAETNRRYVYLTNNFQIEARKIADLYKHRWQIELFFKWIKQHLEIEVFWGHSANAVKTQICVAMCSFLLVAIMKKTLRIERNLYEILQILSVSQFEKTPINTLLSETDLQNLNEQSLKQLTLFDY
jgi:hypothetical protein